MRVSREWLRGLLSFSIAVMLLRTVSAGGQAPAAPLPLVVDVELIVRGPDAQPLRNTSMSLASDEIDRISHQTVTIAATTDADGIAHFKAPEGVYSFSVEAQGVGYTSTGIVAFASAQTARPKIPALVPFGLIEGTIPPEAVGLETKVVARLMYGDKDVPVNLDSAGHFKLPDAQAGLWYVWAARGKQRLAQAERQIFVAPGQRISNVILKPIPPSQKQPPAVVRWAPRQGEGQTVVWVAGNLHDEAGKPVAGATVYAASTYFGGMRMYGDTASAITDADGNYQIKGKGGLDEFSITLVASVPGHPPVWAWPQYPSSRDKWVEEGIPVEVPPPPQPPTADLIVPTSGGKLEVTVLSDGHPAAGALVTVYLQNANLRDTWTGSQGKDFPAVQDVAYPIAQADAAGIARFDHLLPGNYDVDALAGTPQTLRSLPATTFRVRLRESYAQANGIPVRINQTTRYALSIHAQPNQAGIRVVRPDGKPAPQRPSLSYGRRDVVQRITGIDLDPTGLSHAAFETPGLWYAEFAWSDPPARSWPVSEPCIAAFATLAISPLLESAYVPTFSARAIEAASVEVSVADVAGKPVRAVVEIDRPLNKANYAGSTGEDGKVVFGGLVSWPDYLVRVFAPGLEYLDLNAIDSPLQSIERMKNRTEYAPVSLDAQRDTRSQITMKPQRVGYIVGKVTSDDGSDLGNLMARISTSAPEPGAVFSYHAGSGEYAAGPFLGGPVKLHVIRRAESGQTEFDVIAEVKPGDVSVMDFKVPSNSRQPTTNGQMLIDAGGASAATIGTDRLTGQILCTDGKTPALGAECFYLQPGQAQPTIFAFADALGNLHPRGLRQNLTAQPPGIVIGPTEPTIIALLPGECGATIIAPAPNLDNPIRVILPPPLAVSGHVSIGGKPPASPALIHVLAASQDRGALNRFLSVQTTANTDGDFTLAGLTPGRYQVQVSLDNIWLSASQMISISAGQNLPQLSFDIGAPGAAVLVHLKDAAGKSAAGESIKLDRPPGPLGEALWPAQFECDGAGIVYIPTLEAGQHVIRAANGNGTTTVTLPPLPATRPVETDLIVPITRVRD